MTRSIRRIAATAAVVVVEPMDPQPIVAGHEGDVLLRVSIAMPAEVAAPAPVKKATAKKASARKVRAKATRAARR